MLEEVLVPLTIFSAAVLIVWIVFHHGSKNRREVLETVRQAAQSGTQLTPEVIRALGMPARSRTKGLDIRWGVIFTSIAVGFIIMGWIISSSAEEPVVMTVLSSIAVMPGMIGLALIGMGVFMRDKSNDAE